MSRIRIRNKCVTHAYHTVVCKRDKLLHIRTTVRNVTCRQVSVKRSYDMYEHICNTCSLHEVEVTISGTINVIDLFLSMHYLTHGPTYKTNVSASEYVEQTFMFSVI